MNPIKLTPQMKFPKKDNFLTSKSVAAKPAFKQPIAKPLKTTTKKLENPTMNKTAKAKCDDIVARAKRSRIPVNKKNKYIEKIAVSKGFKFVSTTSGIPKPAVKKPVKPGLMKEAALPKIVRKGIEQGRKGLREAGKQGKKGVDLLSGHNVASYGEKQLRGSHRDAFRKAKTYKDAKAVLEKGTLSQNMPLAERRKVLKKYESKRLAQNVARGAIATGATVYTGGKVKEGLKRKAQEREAMRYYQQRGLL